LVFVNHGDNASCEEFKNYIKERGFNAVAPYSGTEFDLATAKMTIFTEGKFIDRVKAFKGNTRAEVIYGELIAAAERLLLLAKGRRGRPNKDNAKLTSQIRELCEKWKD
jgi:metallo-beta-lactamase family protein